jgi:hypothetical protein
MAERSGDGVRRQAGEFLMPSLEKKEVRTDRGTVEILKHLKD